MTENIPVVIGDYINLDEALGRVRGNKKLYRRMLGLFLASEEFTALEEHLLQQDYAKAADVAHGIKGMTGNLSLSQLFKTSTHLMDILRQGAPDEQSLADYREAYTNTKSCVEALLQEPEDA